MTGQWLETQGAAFHYFDLGQAPECKDEEPVLYYADSDISL